jgi:hypothetical protein
MGASSGISAIALQERVKATKASLVAVALQFASSEYAVRVS